jgi:hypothetical protein
LKKEIFLENGDVEREIKVAVDERSKPVEIRLPNCMKVCWQCRHKSTHLCVSPMSESGNAINSSSVIL